MPMYLLSKSDLYIKIPKHPLELVKLDMPLLFTIYPTKVLGKKPDLVNYGFINFFGKYSKIS